jgi:hypothetical protein
MNTKEVEAARKKSGLKDSNESVKVAIRCRPMNEKETTAGHAKAV